MAGALSAKALANLVVHVGIDDSRVSVGLQAMKNSVRAATTEWRAQFAIFNQLGDHVGAAKAKYDGLTESIHRQKGVVDEQRSQLKSMGQRTTENATAYDKLTYQINQNVNKLASLGVQQEKAKKMYDFEQSGIRGNKEELSLLQREMESTVKMYRAQGDEQKASEAQAKGLKEQISQLVTIQGKEQSILEKIKSESGENSKEYREQAIRVNELSSKIAHSRSEYDHLGDSLNETSGRFAKLRDRASSAKDIFKGSFFGSLAGNLVTNAIARVTGGIHSIIEAGTDENKVLESVHLTWTNFTHSAKQGEAFTKVIEEMHEKSHYSLQSVSALNKMMFALTKNKEDMITLSDSIQHVGRAAGLSDTQITQIGKRLAQVGVTGKISYSDVAKMSRQVPGFAKVMSESMGVPAEKLVEMGKKGKLTGKNFQDAIVAMGKANQDSYKNYEHTTAGFSAVMHDTWDKLSQRLMKPIFNMKKSGLSSLTAFVQDKAVERGATAVGKALSEAMGVATDQISRLVKYVQSHKEDFTKIIDGIKSGVEDLWKTANPVVNFLIEHPKLLEGAAAGLLGISVAMKAVSVGSAIAAIGIDGLKTALISSGIGIAVVAIGIAAVELIAHWKEVKKFFGGIGNWFKGIWHGITGGVSSFVGGIKDHWNDMISNSQKRFSSMADSAKDKFSSMRKWSTDLTNKMADQVMDKYSWLNKHTNGAASTMFSGLKKTFKSGHKTMESATDTFKDLIHGKWSKLGSDMKKTSSSAMSTVKSYFRTGYNTLNSITGGRLGDMLDKVKSIGGKIVNYFKNLPHRMADGIKNGWHGIENAFIDLGNGMLSGIGKGVNGVISGINWILGKIHVPKLKKWKVPQYAMGGKADGLAIVGEKNKHELIKYADGHIEVSPNRATLYNFRQPVSILGGDKTEQLMKSGVIPQFGLGNWLGDAIDFVKGGWSSISKGASGFWNAVTHPSELLNTAVDKFTDLSGLNGTIADMAKGTVTYATKSALSWIKDKLSLSDDPGGSGVERWRPYVVRALAMNDLSTSNSMVNKVLRQITTESGGNAHAVQHGYTDVNTLSGDLAKGLMQTISATFNAYKFPGHGDIFKGFDNMLAALNYAKHRYGPSLSALGKGRGYANGAIVAQEQFAHIAEGNKPEAIIPLTNQNRAIQLMYQVLDYLSNKQGGRNSGGFNGTSDNSSNDKLLAAMEQNNKLLSLLIQVVQALHLNIDLTSLAKGLNTTNGSLASMLDFQSIGGGN